MVNLLTPEEIDHAGIDKLPESTELILNPIDAGGDWSLVVLEARLTGDFSKVDKKLNPEFHKILTQEAKVQYADLYREIIHQDDQPIVFHCSHGIHRTGTASAILLWYLGVPWETVREDYLLSNDCRKEEIEKRVNDVASILGLQDLLLRKPFELSGGQRQRVAMGRAIVRKPSVFLFDEPLSNLDAKLRTQMRTEIKRLHQNVQSTIIYVTHDQVEAMTLADRIVVMKDGNIEQVGKPLELFENPVNTFVAGFIGSPPMNLMPAKIVSNDDCLTLQFNTDFNIPIPEKPGHSLEDGMAVTMGLRTEDLTIDNGNHSFPDPWKINGLVEVVEPLGSETIMHMDFNGIKFVAKSEGRRIVHPGEKIRIAMNLEHLHLFDVDSSLSIY